MLLLMEMRWKITINVYYFTHSVALVEILHRIFTVAAFSYTRCTIVMFCIGMYAPNPKLDGSTVCPAA